LKWEDRSETEISTETYMNMKSKKSKPNVHPLFIALFFVFSACERDETPTPVDACENTNYTYINDISTIINQKCASAGCHDGSNSLRPFTTYNNVFNVRLELKNAINTNFEGLPPQAKGRLTEDEQEIIVCWVNDGGPE